MELVQSRVTDSMNADLKPFIKEEIRQSIMSMSPLKAPRIEELMGSQHFFIKGINRLLVLKFLIIVYLFYMVK